jgi:magnesium chelatase subunit I
VNLSPFQQEAIVVPELIAQLIEQIAVEARSNEFVDEKSGVSARLPISAYETVVSAVERRMLINGEKKGTARMGDLQAAIPAIVGKIEMVYEGEQEGAVNVAHRLISSAVRTLAPQYFPGFDQVRDKQHPEIREKYLSVMSWFEKGHELDLMNDASEKDYVAGLGAIKGLEKAIKSIKPDKSDNSQLLMMEYLLHVLAEYSLLDKKMLETSFKFQDFFSSIMPQE